MASTKKNTETATNKETVEKATVETKDADTVEETTVVTEESKPVAKSTKSDDALATINKTLDSVAGVADDKPVSRTVDIPLTDEIAVRSVTFGGLTWISPKTNAKYRWNEIGAVEYIQFSELVTMNNTSQAFLTEPRVILLDDRAVEHFRLKPVYEKIAVVDSLEELFAEGDLSKIEQALRNIRNTSMRNVAISKIKELRGTRALNDVDVIRLIERILCFDME